MQYQKYVFVLVVLAASGCGQSKVDFQKKEVTQVQSTEPPIILPAAEPVVVAPPKILEDKGDTVVIEEVVPHDPNDPNASSSTDTTQVEILKNITLRLGKSVNSPFSSYRWQNWNAPATRGGGVLGGDELRQLGDLNDYREEAGMGRYTMDLVGKSGQRCVFRNRLLETGSAQADKFSRVTQTWPNPFGAQDLFCETLPKGIKSRVHLAFSNPDYIINPVLQWVGTTAVKDTNINGSDVIQFKMTQRIGYNQRFGDAADSAFDDDFDTLINATSVSEKALEGGPTDCVMERTYILMVKMTDGRPKSGRLVVKTRFQSMEELDQLAHKYQFAVPVNYANPDAMMPVVNYKANRACSPQRRAWLYCLKDSPVKPAGVNCPARLTNAVEKNFRGMLDARLPGFHTDRMFNLTRQEGNVGDGTFALWHEASVKGSNSHMVNPLSLEDFQEVTDVVELGKV